MLLGLLLGRVGYAQTRPTAPASPAVICWHEGVKLRWRDFQAEQNPLAGTVGFYSRAGAVTSAEVAVLPYEDARGRPALRVQSFFVKKSSWVRDSAFFFNFALLEHEQLHFDINELFARKVRSKIADCSRAGGDAWGPELSAEIECLLQEQEEFNAAFDQEAHADPSAPPVRKWQAIVRRELAALAVYKSSAATCDQ